MARKFYRTVIQVEILSEDKIDTDGMSLAQIGYEIVEGDWSGRVTTVSAETLDGPAMAKALQAQDSDPEFFFLDELGNEFSEEQIDQIAEEIKQNLDK
jgi:hypothetical protein